MKQILWNFMELIYNYVLVWRNDGIVFGPIYQSMLSASTYSEWSLRLVYHYNHISWVLIPFVYAICLLCNIITDLFISYFLTWKHHSESLFCESWCHPVVIWLPLVSLWIPFSLLILTFDPWCCELQKELWSNKTTVFQQQVVKHSHLQPVGHQQAHSPHRSWLDWPSTSLLHTIGCCHVIGWFSICGNRQFIIVPNEVSGESIYPVTPSFFLFKAKTFS